MKLRELVFCSTAFLLTISAPASAATASAKGSKLFQSRCVMCHGTDGTGNTPAGNAFKVVSYRNPAVMKMSDADLTAIISNGKNRMPAYVDRLDAVDIQSLVAYIRTLQGSNPQPSR